jgi:hypothetical protein
MEGEESDWDDLADWVRDFLDKNELTELVWNYLKSRPTRNIQKMDF